LDSTLVFLLKIEQMKIADRPRSRLRQHQVIAIDGGSTISGCSEPSGLRFGSFGLLLVQIPWGSFEFETNLTSYR
jgi:hypothetical protein